VLILISFSSAKVLKMYLNFST